MPKNAIETVDFKWLKLINPERAQALVLDKAEAPEAPVFVSYYQKQQESCEHCNKTYTPLIYQIGYSTTAQHGCPEGGIYHLTGPDLPDNSFRFLQSNGFSPQ